MGMCWHWRWCYTCIIVLLLFKQVKWLSLLHHVTNEHEWLSGQCDHEQLSGPPTDGKGNTIEYFNRDEPAFQALKRLMTDKRWMKSMKYYVNFRQANLQTHIVTVAKTIHIQAHWHSGIISQLPVSLLSKKKCISEMLFLKQMACHTTLSNISVVVTQGFILQQTFSTI